ncbi:hypothetical protein JCM11641_007964 [Rhodosporidiobolus odoratus]
MPSHPTLAPLSISNLPTPSISPLTTPTSARLGDEHQPLLGSHLSLSAQRIKRRSAKISDLLFNHADPADSADGGQPDSQPPFGTSSGAHPDQQLVSPARGREMSRTTSFFGGTAGGASLVRTRTRTGYDGEFRRDFEGEYGNGVRSWYDNFHTIDWIHDAIKHSLRLRRLRSRKYTEGLRGRLANWWDGLQGWVLVSLVGFFTACIAYCIITSEMLLFDLKEGYCVDSWRTAKRFCCREAASPAALLELGATSPARTAMGGMMLRGWGEGGEEGCEQWRTWDKVWEGWTGEGEGAGEAASYIAFIVIAIAFSTLSSFLTIYLTASTSVFSSKDSPSVPHPGISPEFASSLTSPAHGNPGGAKYGATDPSISTANEPNDGEVTLQQRPRKTLYYAAGSGIPEVKVILSGFVIRGYLGSWTLAIKSIGLTLSVASGLTLGKEGPFVQIASCLSNIISRFFPKFDRNEAKRREIISAGCAAGVAVSFGAPIGGVLFSLEEVSYYFPPRTMLRSFFCAMIAAMTLKLLNPFGSGKIVLFAVTYDKDWHTLELIGFFSLAVFGGLYGAFFCKANIWWTKHVRNGTFLKQHPIVEVALVTLVTVCISFYNPYTKMGGTELISSLFSECHKHESLSGLCVATPAAAWPLISSISLVLLVKALLTVCTFGIKLPAGIFIPTLCVGACAGRIAGLLVEIAHARWPTAAVFDVCRPTGGESGPLPFGQACVIPGVWAMVGAAATLAGVTRTTVSLAVIVFELTGTLTYSVPTMLAVLIAKTVADSIEPRSIYDLVIELADLPYLDAKAEYIHESSPGDIVDREAPIISLDHPNTVASLRTQLAALYASGTASGFPIVGLTQDEPVVGRRMYAYIASKELEHGLVLAKARGLGDSSPLTFRAAQAAAKGLTGGPGFSSGAVTPSGLEGTQEGMDLSWLTDSAPIVVNVKSPMELLHEMFAKLGIRYLVCVDNRGLYVGSLEKARYLRYLQWLEKHHEERGKRKVSGDEEASDR